MKLSKIGWLILDLGRNFLGAVLGLAVIALVVVVLSEILRLLWLFG